MNPILLASLISLGGLGLVFGALLAFASKIFSVKVDPRVEQIAEILPNANCGACGYAGCTAFAEAVARGEAATNLCIPGGASVAHSIAEIMGVEAKEVTKRVAVVRCGGGKNEAVAKYVYEGLTDCHAAELLGGGSKACKYGCLGLGSCVSACPYDAIAMSDDGLPVVFEEKCIGCGLCAQACPRGIIEMIPITQKVYVACVSHDRGKNVKAVCSVGCTGCTLCASPKFVPSGKVKIEDNLPTVSSDWEDFSAAVEKCPAKCFVVRFDNVTAGKQHAQN